MLIDGANNSTFHFFFPTILLEKRQCTLNTKREGIGRICQYTKNYLFVAPNNNCSNAKVEGIDHFAFY